MWPRKTHEKEFDSLIMLNNAHMGACKSRTHGFCGLCGIIKNA